MSPELERSEVARILIGDKRKRQSESTCCACGSSRRAGGAIEKNMAPHVFVSSIYRRVRKGCGILSFDSEIGDGV